MALDDFNPLGTDGTLDSLHQKYPAPIRIPYASPTQLVPATKNPKMQSNKTTTSQNNFMLPFLPDDNPTPDSDDRPNA